MKYLFIVNPSAGHRDAKQIKNVLENKVKINKRFEHYDCNFIIPASIKELNNIMKRKIEDENISSVIAVGGDGTIASIAHAIIDYPDISIGIVPHGTGNILASNLGIKNDFDSSLETIFQGEVKQIDLGLVNEKPFTIVAGTGLPAHIIENIKPEDKATFGIWAYFIKGLEHLYTAQEFIFDLNIDGKEINTKSIAVLVSNAGNFLGPFPTLTPEAQPHDGYLDVLIVSLKSLRENPIEYFRLLINYLTRNLKSEEGLQNFKAKDIVINSSPKLKVQADGDIVAETPVKIEILPKRLKVLVPSKAPTFAPSINDIIEKIEEIFNIKLST